MVFSAYSRLILLSDGIWDKTANVLQREAFRLRMIGTDDSLQLQWSVKLLKLFNKKTNSPGVAMCSYNENTEHSCPAHQSVCMFEAECGAHTPPPIDAKSSSGFDLGCEIWGAFGQIDGLQWDHLEFNT